MPRDEPIAKTIVLGRARQALLREVGDDLLATRLDIQTVISIGIDQKAISIGGDARGSRILFLGIDDDADRKSHRSREIEVSLIVCRDSHDRTSSIVGKDIVTRPDRDPLTIDWIDRISIEEDAALLPIGGESIDLRCGANRFQILLEIRFDTTSVSQLPR